MKKRLCLLLAALLMICSALPAFAAAGTIDDYDPYLKTMQFDVAVSGGSNNLSFYGSIDGSDMVELKAAQYPDEKVGHIIVVDQGWTWTSHITWETLLPAINAYLNSIPSGQKVMFVLSEDGPTNYMSVSQAKTYARDNITLPNTTNSTMGKPSNTAIDDALVLAFTKATQTGSGDPVFKNVFALVDPGSNGAGSSATKVRDDYIKNGGFFPVLIAAVYPKTFMENASSNNTADDQINRGMSLYTSLAEENGSVLARLNYVNGEALPTSNIVTMKETRSYYSLDLSPLHNQIDYARQTHELTLTTSDGRNVAAGRTFTGITASMLPTAIPTATPKPVVTTKAPVTAKPTATPTNSPTPTPDPYVVHPGDEHQEALLAILALRELYYITSDKVPSEFDTECQAAFVKFCENNGLTKETSISEVAYELLISGKAVPAPTATPTFTPEPEVVTPAPTDVPLIYDGSSNTATVRAIMKLKELYYLDADLKVDEWNSQCMVAFQELCKDNNYPSYTNEYIDEEMYEWLIDGNLQPKATATPEPTVTAVPEATIPPEGYALYQNDTEDSTFIAQMQTVLQNLNLYDPSQAKTVGMLDDPTMDAVVKYCETYGLTMPSTEYVDSSIVKDILNNGGSREPYVEPDPTMSEKILDFLQKEAVALGDFSVKMWMLLALVVALVFIILLIVILTNKKANDSSGSSFPIKEPAHGAQPARPSMPVNAAPMGGRMPQTPAGGFGEETVPLSGAGGAGFGDEETKPLSSGVNVTLNITGGVSAGTRRVLIDSRNFIIGRPSTSGAGCDLPLEGDGSVSRKHAALSYQNNQLYLFNLSSNGTRVNGQPVGDTKSAAATEETMPLYSSEKQSNGGYAVKRGDMIEISSYRITVNW